jgi:hypothetical protein
MKAPISDNPWDWMQPFDVKRFGEVILDPEEQTRWCRAVMLCGLLFMWNKAQIIRGIIYEKLELGEGDKVLLLGEVIEPWGLSTKWGSASSSFGE